MRSSGTPSACIAPSMSLKWSICSIRWREVEFVAAAVLRIAEEIVAAGGAGLVARFQQFLGSRLLFRAIGRHRQGLALLGFQVLLHAAPRQSEGQPKDNGAPHVPLSFLAAAIAARTRAGAV